MNLNFRWMKYTPLNLPPQGLKILCFSEGGVWVAQMFMYKNRDYWIPIPFTDSRFADTMPPDYWMFLEFPEDYTGYLRIGNEKDQMTFDKFQENNPKDHQRFVKMMLKNVGKRLDDKEPEILNELEDKESTEASNESN